MKLKILGISYKIAGLGERNLTFDKGNIIDTKNCTVISGENYSGKTVLLSLLTPKAIDKSFLLNNQIAGLYSEKELAISKDNVIYILYSKVTNSGITCSFKVDGVEQCNNGKVTLYNELLKVHELNNTIDIIDHHSSYFFDLSPIERKKYIQENYIQDYEVIEKWRNYVNNRSNILTSKISDISNYKNNNNKVNLSEELSSLEKLKALHQITQEELLIARDTFSKIKVLDLKEPVTIESLYNSDLVEKADNSVIFELTDRITKLENERKELSNLITSINNIKVLEGSLNDIEAYEILREDVPKIIKFNGMKSDKSKLLLQLAGLEKAMFTNEYHIEMLEKQKITIDTENDELEKFRQELSFVLGKIQSNKQMIEKGTDNPCVKSECLEMLKEENSKLEIDSNSIRQKVEDKLVKINELNGKRKKCLFIQAGDLEKNKKSDILNDKIKDLENAIEEYLASEENTCCIKYKDSTFDIIENKLNHSKKMFEREDKNKEILNKISLIKSGFDTNFAVLNEEELVIKVATISSNLEEVKSIIKCKENLLKLRKDIEAFNSNQLLIQSRDKIKKEIEEKSKYINEVINFSADRYNTIKFTLRRLEEDEIEFEGMKIELEKLLELKEVLHVNGLPKILIQSELLKLENMINDNIHKFFTNDIKLSFDYTDKKLEINIRTKHSPSNSYESLSGAEKSIVKIASSLAFQKENMTVVRLDEIDAFFDESNRLSFSSFLENLSRYADQVFCISHNTELLDNNNFNTINLSKE